MNSIRCKLVFALVVCFFIGGIVPACSQQILASAGLGKAWMSRNDIDDNGALDPWVAEANVLFVGNSGFTVSTGSVIDFMPNDAGAYFAPIIGLGFVSYTTWYFGIVLNVSTMLQGGAMIAPTVVLGYDLGSFLAQAQVSYLHSFRPSGYGLRGFRISIGAGVNLGAGSNYR